MPLTAPYVLSLLGGVDQRDGFRLVDLSHSGNRFVASVTILGAVKRVGLLAWGRIVSFPLGPRDVDTTREGLDCVFFRGVMAMLTNTCPLRCEVR